MPPHRRIAAVLDHLGITRAHFAAGLASEILPLMDTTEQRVAVLPWSIQIGWKAVRWPGWGTG